MVDTNQNPELEDETTREEVFTAVNSVYSQLSAIEKFVARRFDEISMEINATSQQVDMAEDGIVNRFAEILEVLSAITFTGGGDSAANTGVELEAIIADTEGAANKILDAAERISEVVDNDSDWNDEQTRNEARAKIQNDIQEILMACSFQDLTGQRVRNTLDNLQQIENRLGTTFEKLGIDVKPSQEAVEGQITKRAEQDDIDKIMESDNSGVTQDDIDSMFENNKKDD